MSSALKYKTLYDFEQLPEDSRAELIDGEFYDKMMPGGEHSSAESNILTLIKNMFHKRFNEGDGTGGWWILSEVSVYYQSLERILTPDIVGWKRVNTPEKPKGYPVKSKPDWVCEVCHSTKRKDTTIVPQTLAAEGVEWYWLLDLKEESLQVWRLNKDKKFEVVHYLYKNDGKQRIMPFFAIEIEIAYLFGDDLEE